MDKKVFELNQDEIDVVVGGVLAVTAAGLPTVTASQTHAASAASTGALNESALSTVRRGKR